MPYSYLSAGIRVLLFLVILVLPHQAVSEDRIDRLSGPFTHENLSIYLVHGLSAPGPVPLTLAEAMQSNLVRLHETGEVGHLSIENLSDQEVFIQSGDMVKGGKQDRVLTTSLILKPQSGPTQIDSYCVEAGRWNPRAGENGSLFISATRSAPSRELKLAVRTPLLARTAPRSAVVASLPDPASSQNEVWRDVAKAQADLSKNVGTQIVAPESPTSLQLALENPVLREAEQRYLSVLQPFGEKDDDVIGYVVAINGKLNSADVYGSNGLFQKMWPKVLRASVTEAVAKQRDGANRAVPQPEEAKAFLKRGNRKSDIRLSNGTVVETGIVGHILSFGARKLDGSLVHLNFIASD